MARAWEADFIRLWEAGATQAAIAQALGIPLGTVKSHAHTLQQQGRIQPRPRGGLVPVQPPVQKTATGAEHSVDTDAEQRIDTDAEQRIDTGAVQSVATGAEQGLDTAAVQRLDRLEDELHGLREVVKSLVERLEHPAGSTPVQITTLPPYPKGKAVRWNLWILDAIREELASLAAERDISPSQLVQEWLWKMLTDRRAAREPAP